MEVAAESSARPVGTDLAATVGGGGSARPFTLKNLEALGKFSGIKQPAATMWLIQMSHWIRLSKVLESDLWDVVATRMTWGVLTWINNKLCVAEELDVQQWPTWQVFVKAL